MDRNNLLSVYRLRNIASLCSIKGCCNTVVLGLIGLSSLSIFSLSAESQAGEGKFQDPFASSFFLIRSGFVVCMAVEIG